MHMAQNKEEVVQQWLGIRQHCRLTLWTYDWWYRKSTHQRQRVSEQKIQTIILILKRGRCLVGRAHNGPLSTAGCLRPPTWGPACLVSRFFLEEAPVVEVLVVLRVTDGGKL